jgi:hypothetical protein
MIQSLKSKKYASPIENRLLWELENNGAFTYDFEFPKICDKLYKGFTFIDGLNLEKYERRLNIE